MGFQVYSGNYYSRGAEAAAALQLKGTEAIMSGLQSGVQSAVAGYVQRPEMQAKKAKHGLDEEMTLKYKTLINSKEFKAMGAGMTMDELMASLPADQKMTLLWGIDNYSKSKSMAKQVEQGVAADIVARAVKDNPETIDPALPKSSGGSGQGAVTETPVVEDEDPAVPVTFDRATATKPADTGATAAKQPSGKVDIIKPADTGATAAKQPSGKVDITKIPGKSFMGFTPAEKTKAVKSVRAERTYTDKKEEDPKDE